MAALPLSEGTTFAGRYRIVRHIAAGGMGDVYEAVHRETERSFALKVMRPHALSGDDMRERFRREARVTARIRSEHLVEIFDAGVDEATDMPFLVMELLEGEDVGTHLERAGRLSPGEVVTLLHQTALAIDKMHKAGVVHRDLKPENIFLTERDDGSPRVKVLDFGIAKILASPGDPSTITSDFVGTPLYMAPEQFRAGVNVSPAADIYSIGMLAYTMLVAAPYWKREIDAGASVPVLASVIMTGSAEKATARASRLGVTLPRAFDAWLARATAPLPEQRFATAQAAVAELADALGVPRPARQEPSPPSPRDLRPMPAPLSSQRPAPIAEKSPAVELSAMSRTASSPVHHSFATTSATKTLASRRATRGRRKLELAVVLGASLVIGIAAFVVRSRGSASAAPSEDASTVEPSPSPRAVKTEALPERPSGAPEPSEARAPEPAGGGEKPASTQEPGAGSLKQSPKGSGTGSGAPAADRKGAAVKPKLIEGEPPATRKRTDSTSRPYIHGTPE